jgi:hypothetical protein
MASYKLGMAFKGSKPRISRKVAVDGGMTLGDLDWNIRSMFGWSDFHLHRFSIPMYGTAGPADEHGEYDCDEDEVTIDDIAGMSFSYVYDFGDWLELDIKFLKGDPGAVRFQVLEEKGAAPPEDFGGTRYFCYCVAAAKDPRHPDHDECLQRLIDFGVEPEEL